LKFQRMEGVITAVAGYMGGIQPNPSYERIQDYAEALWIEFDPAQASYRSLLQKWTKLHTPKTPSHQYRSSVWYLTETQKAIALEVVNKWKGQHSFPLFSSVESISQLKFYRAEEYHQDYYLKTGQARFVS
jgi:peptide-methionine (S)-S-oxide reductase